MKLNTGCNSVLYLNNRNIVFDSTSQCKVILLIYSIDSNVLRMALKAKEKKEEKTVQKDLEEKIRLFLCCIKGKYNLQFNSKKIYFVF